MLKSYFIIGIRNLFKQKFYAIIKILGLAFGLAASIVIYLYVQEDLYYDRFHPKYERIVRVLTIDQAEGVSSKLVGVTPPALGPAAKAEIPEVENSVRMFGGGRLDLSYEGNLLKCDAGFRSESSIFDVFGFTILEGKKVGTLDEPNTIAITLKLSKRLFRDTSPIGKVVKLNQTTELHVVALVADPPANSHIQFDLLRSLTPSQTDTGFAQFLQSWQGINAFTYLLLHQQPDIDNLNAKLKELNKKNNGVEYFVPVSQRLEDVHLKSKEILFEANNNKSDMLNVYVLSTISFLILLLACVNFMNLVTAKSAGRAKEVGMRKVIGAARSQLVFQHLTESLLVAFVSALVAVAIVFVFTPLLNTTYQRFADPFILLQPINLAFFFGLIVVVGMAAGTYPAFVLSSFKPILVLKGAFKSSTQGTQLRKALVVLQFTISIALMVGTGIVYQQMDFIYSANLGYNRDQIITLALSGQAAEQATNLKNELLRNPNITAVGTSSTRIGQQVGRTNIIPEGFSTDTNIIASIMNADETFVPTMGMEMKAGRNFSPEFEDSLSMIINEEMTRLLKWDDAVGRKISLNTGPNPTDVQPYTVIGVVKDFHFATLRHKLEPMFILYSRNNGSLAIKVKAEGMKETLGSIEATWKKILPGAPFEYNFLDEEFAKLYRNEQAFATMFTHFTVLAILIAVLGLFALSAFTTEQRKKEIGIRKVLGASNTTLFVTLSSQFVMLIGLSFILASCIAYYVMGAWLTDFQYSITIGPMVFVVAGMASLGVALLTISYQAVRAMMGNPVEALRSE